MPFSSIPEALEDFRAGKMIVVVDDEDRENEGDLTIAAEKVTPEIVNFMARYGRGLVCLPMTGERLDELRIPLMVRDEQNSRALRHRLLRADRGPQGHDHRHLRRRPGEDRPRRDRPPDEAGGPRPPRPHVPAAGLLRRRAAARRPDRGGRGPRAAGRPLPGRRHLRGDERGRDDGARAAARGLLPRARHPDDHDPRPHPVPDADRAPRAQDRRGEPADLVRRLPHPRLREPDRRASTTWRS